MKIGIIAGNRSLPVTITQEIKKTTNFEVVAVCFKGETSSVMCQLADKTYWIVPGKLGLLREIVRRENVDEWIMAGQISPWRIFNRKHWDEEIVDLFKEIKDTRPHTIFEAIIDKLEVDGAKFVDSTKYLSSSMAQSGIINGVNLDDNTIEDVDFGVKIVSRFVDLDVGQTIVVKSKSVVALEGLEGTDNTIRRAYKIAGEGCVVFKFSKKHQNLRFDVPVVGMQTLKLARKVQAKALVLEESGVIIIDKNEFLRQSKKWGIAVVGKKRQ